MKPCRFYRTSLPLLTAALTAAGVISTHAEIQTAPPVFVDIDATALPYGAVLVVTNAGTLGGVFQGFSNPVIADSPGAVARGLQFDGTAYMILLSTLNGPRIAPPAGLVGLNPTRSIEAWAFNPAIADEETMVSWGQRGGPDGSNMSFNYGANSQFGAVGHWGAAGPDIGWNDGGGAPEAGRWHHLAYTYDGTTTRVYADGVLANMEVLGAGVINTITNTSIQLATQLEADGTTPTATLRGSLLLAKVRIHDGVLTPAQILNNFNAEKMLFTGPVRLALSPTNQTAVEGGSATFVSQATGDPPITYQWVRGSAPISGATNSSYTLEEVLLSDNNATFAVLATNLVNGSGALSTNATLSVTPDVTGPVLVGAAAASQSSLTVLDAVSVALNEKVSAVTANNRNNYTLTGPQGAVPISSASIDTAGRSVLLVTPSLVPDASYTLTVNGLRDRSAAGNLIAPNSQATFTASQFAITNVGVSVGGTATTVPGGYDVSAAGRDIGGTNDEFGFHARVYAGDFDVQTRLESLDLSDGYSEAGLMARPPTGTNAMFAAVLAGPSLGGVKFQSRAATGATALGNGFMPVNYPYTWLRLQRVGNLFTGLGSIDGQTWQRLGSANLAMPSSVYVGFAVNSHQTNFAALARFREPIAGAGGAVVNSLALPFEPLGPSSRRTGLVFSEIMYHPLDVPGLTNSLEFIEIFNGQEYFEDLSGFKIRGDVDYDFPTNTILQGGAFLVVARDPAAVQSYYGITGVLGPWRMQTNVTGNVTNVATENLPNGHGTVRLENELGGHLLQVDYDSKGGWPAAADGAGHSLVLARPSYGEGNPRAWAASELIGGSPGRREAYRPEPQRAVVINEFLAHTDLPQMDFVELFNTSTQSVDISGCWLSDDFGTNKYRIANGMVLPARGFVAFTETELGFALSSDGEELFLVNSNRTRVLDAVRFGGQENGVSSGRFPDGAPTFCRLAAPTPKATNAACRACSIVINEIMYNPISGDDDDEFIELYNRGVTATNIGGWRLNDGISFTIPDGTTIAADGYLVIAKNRTNLLARYPGLNPNLVAGDYSGQLANGGERVALAMPDFNLRTNGSVITTNVFYIDVNEVSYGDGGRWGQWSDGGGSSLELIDPNADTRLAANWADSDETQKAPWSLIERTAIIDLGMGLTGNGAPDRVELFIEGPGECLIDDVECRNNGGPNQISNAGFEPDANGWFFQGTHMRTSLETGGAFSGNNSLHVRATGRGDAGANRVRTAIPALTVGTTNQATLRARVRWLRGDPNILLRIRGQWMECAGRMTLPTNLGTPGAANSRRVSNAGPAITDVTHTPILPAENEPVIVTARAHDSDGIASLTLRYRLDPSLTLIDVPMRDDGTGGDAIAGDGLYSATIPGQVGGTLVAFHLRATDIRAAFPASTTFPNDAPGRECHVRFGESLRSGSIVTYRMWLTQSNINYWTTRERNSNDGIDCTFVYGNWRVVYNAQALYSGSPWHTLNGPYNGPTGNTCDYEVNFATDDLLLGSSGFVLNGQNPTYGATFNQDVSGQAEETGYWFGRKLGLPFMYKRHVFVVLNGVFRGMLYFDHQQPNQDIVEEYFPDDANGRLHKIEDWFEFDDAGNTFSIITCTLQNFTVAGQKRAERYRWTWRPRARTDPNDFADLFALADAANASSPEPLTSAAGGLVNMSKWMRHLALQHMVGDWDTYGYERGKNCFAYKPKNGPWRLLLWDLDLVLGKDSRGPTDGLFNNGAEPVMTVWYSHPPFVREFWCAMSELVNTWMVPSAYSPLVDARYAAFLANEVPVDSPDSGVAAGATGGMKGWIAARRAYILSQIPAATFSVTTPAANTTNNYLTITGTAPVTAKDILVNGAEYPITWTTATAWSLRVPLAAGANTLVVTAADRSGNILGSRTNSVNYTGASANPEGNVVINEIMFNPPVDGASFVELFNAHPTFAFDLSGWRVNGLDYTFPAGGVLPPRSYVVLGRNRAEFAKTYGALVPFAAEFDASLQNNGETLTLLRPGAQPGEEIVVDKVKYEGRDPWPAAARGSGSSLQLIDAAQDNARVSNWNDGAGWRFYSFTSIAGGTRLLIYLDATGQVFIDDLQLVAGSVAGVGPNLLVNGGFESPLAPAWKIQGTNGTNTAISTVAQHTGSSSLNLQFFPNGTPSQYFYQDVTVPAAVHTFSFWYLPSTNTGTLQFRVSSTFRGAVNVRAPSGPVLINATPAAANAVTVPLPPYPLVWLNEVLPVNTSGLTDGQGEREPWIELYNSSGAPLSLDGLYLSDEYANLAKWPFPPGANLQAGEFKVVFADGEPGESTATEWHTNFRLNSGTGSVALSRSVNGAMQIIDYLNFDNLDPDHSYGSCPDGQLFDRQELFFTTPGASNNCASAPLMVYINEWMAANTGIIRDPADNDADDWFELYNPNAVPVDLGNYFLTDTPTNRFLSQYQVPNNGRYVIPPRGYLLVWADGETGQNSSNRADLHVNFNLRQAGEGIGLFAPDGSLVDAVTFGQQTNNVSMGRSTDGGPNFVFFTTPSPRGSNTSGPAAPELTDISVVGANVFLTYSATPGVRYQVQFKDNLNLAAWNPLGPPALAATSSVTVTDNLGASSQRFYRVVVMQ